MILLNIKSYLHSISLYLLSFSLDNKFIKYQIEIGNPRVTQARIRKNGEFAMFEDIFLTANSLQRDIHVYLG
jgi:hypothetical protein